MCCWPSPVPWLDRCQRQWRFQTALVVLAGGLGLRYLLVGVGADDISEYAVPVAFWCLAAGWAAAEASTWWQRVAVGAIAVGGVVGFFPDDPQRQLVVGLGIAALLVPWSAGASLWIYLTHWQVYPELEAAGRPVLAVVASLVVGLAVAWLVRAVEIPTRAVLSRRY